MSIPYTYRITHTPTGQHYYGARWAQGCSPEDLWVTYFTSSKHVKALVERDGIDSFRVEVRRVFSSIDECRSWEQRVLIRLNVLNNPTWINKNINGRFLPVGKQSPEHIQKRIKRGIDHPHYGKPGTMLGKKHTPEAIAALKRPKKDPSVYKNRSQNTTKVTCPHCGKEGQLVNMKRWHFDRCRDQSHKDR